MTAEAKTIKLPLTLPLEKFPHLQITQASIDNLNNLIGLLNKRKKLATMDDDGLSPYEKNERQIIILKTDMELSKIHSTIKQKEIYFKQFCDNATSILKEMEEKWDTLMAKAEEKKHKNVDLKKILDEADHTQYNDNWEYKINHYLQVKTKVYPSKQTSK